MLYPLLWMIGSSFKPDSEIFTELNPIPRSLDLTNYIRGWVLGTGTSFTTFYFNSFVVCAGAIIGNLLSCSLAAYAFARIRFRLRGMWFAIMLGTLMLPFHVTVVPQYIIFNSLGWTNTFLPLVVPKFFAVDAFFIFLMVQFIRGIPIELEQAAMVDGCNRFQIFTKIIMPLLGPALVTTTIFTFIWTYNDFFSQLLYLSTENHYTVSLGLRLFLDASGQSAWGPMFAMTTLSLVPVILVFAFFQRRLVEGIATTGLKG
ncbi:carbohydrate ABC transporter permease [Mesorhizobium sp. BR1-1-16]|uniref:carbohydrate ABC transporter permease n=1 Tax=Mesorhizobium sp. BR1-1-16 TaxID=2876653 RepID=UPI001CD02193|nr:carbohydrate ABC transporter permease [Mesorhizobium sp. BR1-1-16]MBZ9937524.1 carbohydrate ABC transporter permease [Mesorhizobium sp. BR1-1-16]